jgi:hypothetical protein
MSRDKSKGKITPKQDANWESLISASECQIEECRKRIQALRKSLNFFKKQKEMSVPFPLIDEGRHQKIS